MSVINIYAVWEIDGGELEEEGRGGLIERVERQNNEKRRHRNRSEGISVEMDSTLPFLPLSPLSASLSLFNLLGQHTHTHHSLHCTQSVILYVMLTTLHRLLHKRRLNVIAVHSHDCSIRRERREKNRKKREVLLKGESWRGFAYQICLIYYVIHVRTI